jgi:cytoskeletal protein CcmA (bactofilin family)
MFRTERARPVPPSFLGAGLKVEGDIHSEGDVDIAGTVTGNVTARKMTVFEGGAVNGIAKAETAVVNGVLDGKLTAADVALGSTSRVAADVTYVSLRMEAGAVFIGQSRRVDSLDGLPADMKSLPAPKAAAAPKAVPTSGSLMPQPPGAQTA